MRNFRAVLFIAALSLAGIPTIALGQFTSPLSPQSAVPQLGAQKNSAPPTATEAMTYESGIDPAEYHLGPGDVFECQFWTSGETTYPVVSADNVLFIPNLGSFNVRGQTLAQINQQVMQKAEASFNAKKLPPNQPPVILALYQPRKIYVSVRGDVQTPGMYLLTGATRADVAVDLANKIDPSMLPPREASNEQQHMIQQNGEKRLQSVFGIRQVTPASERYITVTHNDGTRDRVDLVRYSALHDPKSAPPLREGDVVVVPFRDLNAGSLGVYGAVQSAGDFEFVKGDSLMAAIQYAFGPSANADLHHVELTRVGADGVSLPPVVYDLAAIEAHQAPDVTLAPNDRIIVRALPDVHLAAVVDVRGEVAEPGVYPITDGKTTLSEVIQDAGGLTPKAYPAAGVLLRHGYQERLTAGSPEEIAQITRLEDLTVADTANYQRQNSMRPANVSVDMEQVLVHGNHSDDVILADGDEIVIPKQPTSVYLYGFVNNAGYVNYQSGAPLDYYIAQAGGYANGAEKSETAIIKLRTKAWMAPGDTKIEPGDDIYIPKEPDYSEDYKLQRLTTIATVVTTVFSAISLYLLIKRP